MLGDEGGSFLTTILGGPPPLLEEALVQELAYEKESKGQLECFATYLGERLACPSGVVFFADRSLVAAGGSDGVPSAGSMLRSIEEEGPEGARAG